MKTETVEKILKQARDALTSFFDSFRFPILRRFETEKANSRKEIPLASRIPNSHHASHHRSNSDAHKTATTLKYLTKESLSSIIPEDAAFYFGRQLFLVDSHRNFAYLHGIAMARPGWPRIRDFKLSRAESVL